MITAIEIANFKGIGARQRIELRPLTLLFGANSAGKSSLLHALHYAREVFERHNLDADQTIAGGPFVDLGGFRNFVHWQDLGCTVLLRFELEFPIFELPNYGVISPIAGIAELQEALGPVAENAAVEVWIAWSELRSELYVSRYAVEINGSPLATIECDFGRRTSDIVSLNTQHEYFHPESAELSLEGFLGSVAGDHFDATRPIPLAGQRDALPNWGRFLQIPSFEEEEEAADSGRDRWNLRMALFGYLTQAIVGPGEVLRRLLSEFRYLGPLRETPPRAYAPPRFPDPSRWADGLGAWDLLHSGPTELVEATSHWLADEDKLKAGYTIARRDFRELDTTNPLSWKPPEEIYVDEFEQLRDALEHLPVQRRVVVCPNGTKLELRPHDIGIGISQVVPVVVTALDAQVRLLAIEQPELHLHPRLQAELGDLFIEAALGDRKHRILLETHSEHLILRLLRRIRESANDKPHRGLVITDADVAIYYAKSHQGDSIFTRIDVDKNGDFIQPWPDDFFEIDFYERFGDAR